MANLLSATTSNRMMTTIETVEGLAAPAQARLRRRVRTAGGGGAQRPYIIITVVTDLNNYTANVRTPTDATVLITGVTVKALQPTAGGSMKVGDKMFADIVDDIYYIEPSVLFGS